MGPSIPENDSAVAAQRTAAASVLADFRHELATAPLLNPPGREWLFRLADALGSVLDALDDDETYTCSTCGGTISIFIGHGDAWHHYRGQGTAADPVELYDAGHDATFAQGGAR